MFHTPDSFLMRPIMRFPFFPCFSSFIRDQSPETYVTTLRSRQRPPTVVMQTKTLCMISRLSAPIFICIWFSLIDEYQDKINVFILHIALVQLPLYTCRNISYLTINKWTDQRCVQLLKLKKPSLTNEFIMKLESRPALNCSHKERKIGMKIDWTKLVFV